MQLLIYDSLGGHNDQWLCFCKITLFLFVVTSEYEYHLTSDVQLQLFLLQKCQRSHFASQISSWSSISQRVVHHLSLQYTLHWKSLQSGPANFTHSSNSDWFYKIYTLASGENMYKSILLKSNHTKEFHYCKTVKLFK